MIRIPRVAIVDYGLGNLYSVQRACASSGMAPTVTGEPGEFKDADAVLLPGVGAFGDAMAALNERGLADALKGLAADGKPLIGICLGLQLLMSESHEFGTHAGLGLIEGTVERLPEDMARRLKVPQVSWRPVTAPDGVVWAGGPLDGVADGAFFYFVHSFYVKPNDPGVVLTTTEFGDMAFCSAVRRGNVAAFQFHPERSAFQGMRVYRNISRMLSEGAFA